MNEQLKYTDEVDRSYGLTGVAISIVALDAAEYLESISIDEPVGESVAFTHEFLMGGNPAFSAKMAWNGRLKQFRITTGMLIANLMCRSYVRRRSKLSPNIVKALKQIVFDEGVAGCSLDRDETDAVFERSLAYFDNLFSYARVHEVANSLAAAIAKRRTLTAQEIFEELEPIR